MYTVHQLIKITMSTDKKKEEIPAIRLYTIYYFHYTSIQLAKYRSNSILNFFDQLKYINNNTRKGFFIRKISYYENAYKNDLLIFRLQLIRSLFV